MWSLLLTIGLTLLSGVGDAQGFIHAGKIWQNGRFIWSEALLSALGFQLGVFMYWLALRNLTAYGVASTEIQTVLWFGVTIIGVAALSGTFLRWPAADQIVALGVLAGIGWLLYRTGG